MTSRGYSALLYVNTTVFLVSSKVTVFMLILIVYFTRKKILGEIPELTLLLRKPREIEINQGETKGKSRRNQGELQESQGKSGKPRSFLD
jgi:hypothetical protein